MNSQTNILYKSARNCLHAGAAMALAVMTLLASTAHASDTDVFLGSATADSANVKPNILFIVDTSGSMGFESDTTPGVSRMGILKPALIDILSGLSNVNVGLMTYNSAGGPVRYPVRYIDASVDPEATNYEFNISKTVQANNDDAQQDMVSNSVTTNTTNLNVSHIVSPTTTTNVPIVQLVANGDDGQQNISTGTWTSTGPSLSPNSTTEVGILFQDVDIPAGATILSAQLLASASTPSSGTMSLRYQAEAHDDAPLFPASGSGILSGRTWTTASATASIASASTNQPINSPDLSLVLQEVVSRPGWAFDNNLAFRIQRTAASPTSASRIMYSREGTSNAARQPRLQVSYTLTPAPVQQTMGLRFQNMSIPQGAKIVGAYLDFTAANSSSDPLTYTIRGERVADSVAFAASSNNINGRPKTGASVTWNISDPWLADDNYQSVDFSSVVQEIVDRSDWCGGQALSLILEASGAAATRRVYSKEGASGTVTPPTLYVEYNTENLAAGTGCVVSTFTSQVNYSYNDAEERNGDLRTTDQDLELGRYNSVDQKTGVLFREVNVPPGAEVTSAYLRFTAEDNTSNSVGLTIQGHDVIDPPTFNGDGNISSRTLTSASVPWSPTNWTDEIIYDSPDIKTIVQEIINLPGWQANNNMAFIMTLASGTYFRRAYSYNGNAAKAPRLIVTAKLLLGDLQDIGPQTVREQLIDEVNNLQTVASTPTVNVYMEALRYFRGMDVYWGTRRYNQSSLDRYGRLSHEDSYTGGTLVQPAGCTPQSLNNAACVTEEVTGSPRYISPMTDPCQANYIVLLSDGVQNSFSYNDDTESLAGTCSDADGGAECGNKLAEFANRNDQATWLTGNQTIRTDTIAFAEEVPFLEAMADAGGGANYTANDSATLSAAFTSIIAEILSKPTTFIAPTLTISAYNRLFNSSEIYISIFKPELSAAWQGNVKKYYLCAPEPEQPQEACTIGQLMDNHSPRRAAVADGHIKPDATSGWSTDQDGPLVERGGAGKQIQNQGHAVGSRNIYTYIESKGIRELSDPVNHVVDTNDFVDATMPAITDPTEADAMINWIRGEDLEDEDGDTITNETRWVFGDPLHSAAVTVNFGKPEGSENPEDVVTKLFVGTNDGGFRMINTFNGLEEWMYIPPDLMPMQQTLRNNAGGNHIFGMDGSPTAWIFDKDGDSRIENSEDGDFVKIITGQRRGGYNYFALDVTPASVLQDPADITGINPYLMWTINNNTPGFENLGQTWSRAFRTNILVDEGGNTVKKNVLIFGGGYDDAYDNDNVTGDSFFGTATEGNAIYIIDAETGDLIWSASRTNAITTVAEMAYAIPSDIRLIDMDGDNATDRLYVGDMGGQVWRVDLTGPLTAGSDSNTVVGKFASLSDPLLPEAKRHFMYRPQVALINDPEFSAGEYVAVVLNTGDRENPLAKHVHDRTYVLRDFYLAPGTMGPTIRESDLLNVTDNIQTAATGLDLKSGWYIDLKESTGFIGEKGITEAQILISSKPEDPPIYTFNTYTPSNLNVGSACSVSLGQNRTYFINLLNGTGTDIIDADTKDRSKYNDAYGIAADPTVVQQEGQDTVSVGGGSTYSEEPDNLNLGENLLPIYISE